MNAEIEKNKQQHELLIPIAIIIIIIDYKIIILYYT